MNSVEINDIYGARFIIKAEAVLGVQGQGTANCDVYTSCTPPIRVAGTVNEVAAQLGLTLGQEEPLSLPVNAPGEPFATATPKFAPTPDQGVAAARRSETAGVLKSYQADLEAARLRIAELEKEKQTAIERAYDDNTAKVAAMEAAGLVPRGTAKSLEDGKSE